jgi:hypothetical protein
LRVGGHDYFDFVLELSGIYKLKMEKVPTILVDRSVWRNAITLDKLEVSLKALKWGNLFLLRWVGLKAKKVVHEDKSVDTYASFYPIIQAAKKGKIKLLCTDLIRHELGFEGFNNIKDLVLKDPNLLSFVGPRASFPPDFRTEYEGDEKGGLIRFYGLPSNQSNIDRRINYINEFPDQDWQNIRLKFEHHLVDAFIHWVAHKSNIDFVLTADQKFKNFSRNNSELKALNPKQISTYDLNCELQLGEPDKNWIYGIRNIFIQQRMFDAGTIEVAWGKLWWLKALLKNQIKYTPPDDLALQPSEKQIKQALKKYCISEWKS